MLRIFQVTCEKKRNDEGEEMKQLKFKVGCVVALDLERNVNTNYTQSFQARFHLLFNDNL